MSSSLLEILRVNHEQSERFEVAIGDELDKRPNGQKAKVWQQHRLKAMAEKVVSFNHDIQELGIDADGLLQEELTKMKTNPLDSFYASLQNTLEYYEKFPGLQSMEQPPVEVAVEVAFSGEEVFGKYLDLHPLYLAFINLLNHKSNQNNSSTTSNGGITDLDYLQYLDRFNSFFYLSAEVRGSKLYFDYLAELWTYLRNFYDRIHPLINLESVIADWEKEFEQKLSSGEIKVKGVQSGTTHGSSGAAGKEPQALRLGMFNDAKELEALGMDRLKEALEALGLKCGGTLQDRAQRLWSVRGKKPEEIPANLKVKAKKVDVEAAADQGSNSSSNKRSPQKVAQMEFMITSLCDVMTDIISATRRHAEKQQARSVEEKEQEIMEEEFGLLPDQDDKQDDEDDDAPVYNPLNVPLGWDGKPIPLWLYKLHGLGVEYKCEVCGNHSYWGRKAFDRHFQEWRHANGMRCLGVPNTKHFHDITYIADVLTLYSKIKDQLREGQFDGDMEEEFEDSQGNVLNRRTYEDLARQGLL